MAIGCLAAAVLGIALFCWWLSGNWYARAVVYAPILVLAVGLGAAGAREEFGLTMALAIAVGGWFLASLPFQIRYGRWSRAAIDHGGPWLRGPAAPAGRSAGSVEVLAPPPRG